MTEQKCMLANSYPIECGNHIQSEYCLSVVPHTENSPEKPSSLTLNQFSPSTRLVEGCRPNEKKRVLNHIVQRLEESKPPGSGSQSHS